MRPVSERPDERALRRALLEETDPEPGLTERMLAGYRRDPVRRRTPLALSVAAALLAAAIVATLLVVRFESQRRTTPAATPAPSAPPSSLSAREIVAADFVSPQAGWVVTSDRARPLDAPASVYATTDGGAHWTRQLDLAVNLITLQADADGHVLLGAEGLAGNSFQVQLYSTSDGGAHWRQMPLPPLSTTQGPGAGFEMKDASEAWLVSAPGTTPSGPEGTWTGWHTTDAGATWHRLPPVDYTATFGAGATGILAYQDAVHGAFFCCFQGIAPNRAYVTSDGGAHWQRASLPPLPGGAAAHLAAMRRLPGGQLVALVEGPSPGPAPSPPDESNLLATPAPLPAPGPAYAYVSQDLGAHWSQPRPLPAGAYGFAFRTGDADHWWVPAIGGGAYATADQGRTWGPAAALPAGLATNSVPTFSGATLGWLPALTMPSGRRNELLLTADGGRSWRPIAPPEPIRVRVPCGGGPVTTVARVRLEVYLSTLRMPSLPAGLGQAPGCRYRLHAEGPSTVVIEATPAERGRTYTLGDLFDVWGIPDATGAVPERTTAPATVTVEVNGRQLSAGQDPRSVPLRDGTTITISILMPPGYPGRAG